MKSHLTPIDAAHILLLAEVYAAMLSSADLYFERTGFESGEERVKDAKVRLQKFLEDLSGKPVKD